MLHQRLYKAMGLYLGPLSFHSEPVTPNLILRNSPGEYCLITVAAILNLDAMLF